MARAGEIIVAGIIYGGIELPVIAKAATDRASSITMALVRLSGYSDLEAGDKLRASTPGDVETLRGHMSDMFSAQPVAQDKPMVLLDNRAEAEDAPMLFPRGQSATDGRTGIQAGI